MKRPKAVPVFASLEDAERQLPALVKARLGQAAFVARSPRSMTAGQHVFTIGATFPRIIRDPKTDEGTLSFHRYPSVATVELEQKAAGLVATLPRRQAFFESVEKLEDTVILRAESAFLQSAESLLAKSPLVQNALNPITEILRYLKDRPEAPLSHFGGARQKRYVTFLEGLEYLSVQNETVRAARLLLEFWNRQAQPETILGDIIRQGYPHLSGPLRIRQIVPYVRAANAYFWPSHQAGRPLSYRLADFKGYLRRLYHGYSQTEVKLNNHIADLTEIGVFEQEGTYRVAAQPVWTRFERAAPSFAASA